MGISSYNAKSITLQKTSCWYNLFLSNLVHVIHFVTCSMIFHYRSCFNAKLTYNYTSVSIQQDATHNPLLGFANIYHKITYKILLEETSLQNGIQYAFMFQATTTILHISSSCNNKHDYNGYRRITFSKNELQQITF